MFESKLFKYIDKADHSEKMTPEMIKRIVSGKESLYALSKELGCSYSYLRLIKQGKIYKPQVAEALKDLGLQSAEIHTHDTKLPSEHKAPTANTPFSKPVSLNKTAIINAIDKAATKLKEKGMKRWLKYESKVNKEVKNEVERLHGRQEWINGPKNAHKVYVKYLKQALEGLSVTLKYCNESIELTYDLERIHYTTENDNTDFIGHIDKFTFVEKVLICLNIKGENLKTLLKDGVNHNLFSTFKADMQVEKTVRDGRDTAKLYHHSVSNNIGSHKSGALTTLKMPLIPKEQILEIMRKKAESYSKLGV